MKKSSTSEFPLLERADALVEDLRQNVPKALKEWDAKAIHQARVATRRLKSTLDLMEPVLSSEHAKPFGRVLRRLRRRLGPLRDLDVMIEHLRALRPRKGQVAAVEWLVQQLVTRRDGVRADAVSAKSLSRTLVRLGSWWGLREDFVDAREAIPSLLAQSLHEQLDDFARRAGRLGAAEPHDDSAGTDGELDDPHQLRIAGKHLRYTLEMAAVEGHGLPSGVMKGFKQMQESLGLWHDYVVLSERALLVSLEAMLPHHDAALQTGVLEVAKVLVGRSSRHLDEFHETWRERGEEFSASIRQRFPLTRDLNEPQTDPDPSGSAEIPLPADAPEAVASAV